MSDARGPEQPGRYQRSASGLIGAMVILLVCIAGFVAFRAITRDQPDIRPEPVDYRPIVALAQQAGREIVYPPALPEGWIATGTNLGAAPDPAWGLTLLTADDAFVGVRQDDRELDAMLATYVDAKPEEDEAVGVDSSLAPRWRRFHDEGGDTAYAAELASGDWVLVYGSARPAELLEIVGVLTDAPL